jgi:hypothetical protein
MSKLVHFFDKSEDKTRASLSRHPIAYALIGGTAIVLFWRGIWYTADLFPFLTGPVSVVLSVAVLLITGLFVSFFIGDRIILSGMKGEKKLAEKTATEVQSDTEVLLDIQKRVKKIEDELQKLPPKADPPRAEKSAN